MFKQKNIINFNTVAKKQGKMTLDSKISINILSFFCIFVQFVNPCLYRHTRMTNNLYLYFIENQVKYIGRRKFFLNNFRLRG